MTAREQGFLLLTSFLGDPERRPLTVAQFRNLTNLAAKMEKPDMERELTEADLVKIGCDPRLAKKVLQLLQQTELLQYYLHDGRVAGCTPVTRLSDFYPHRLRSALGPDASGTLWCKGDLSLLNTPAVSVVGSRDLNPVNLSFAEELGKQAALQGYTLVSGNARGADRAAQEACLKNGGKVIAVVADELKRHRVDRNTLYISEEGFDLPFTAQRALQRNRIIHSFSDMTFVVQCGLGSGGTWQGTTENLRKNQSQVICFHDRSKATDELFCMGAVPVAIQDLEDFSKITPKNVSFF